MRRLDGHQGDSSAADSASEPAPKTPRSAQAAGWIVWLGAVVVIAGLVWIWVNVDTDSLLIHVFFEVVAGTIWLGIVWVAMALVGLVLGLGAALTFPLWRKRR